MRLEEVRGGMSKRGMLGIGSECGDAGSDGDWDMV